jgi:hypothetical protein
MILTRGGAFAFDCGDLHAQSRVNDALENTLVEVTERAAEFGCASA